jgi:hypothetical protein
MDSSMLYTMVPLYFFLLPDAVSLVKGESKVMLLLKPLSIKSYIVNLKVEWSTEQTFLNPTIQHPV